MKRVEQVPVERRQTTMREAKFLSGIGRVLLLSWNGHFLWPSYLLIVSDRIEKID